MVILIGTKGLVQKIILVRFSRDMCQTDHTCNHIFPNSVIYHCSVVLIGGGKVNKSTSNHALIVSKHLAWSINWHSSNYELVAHFHGQFCDSYCEYYIGLIGWYFHGITSPSVPLDWFFYRNEYYSNIPPSFKIMCIICIHEVNYPNMFSLWIWHYRWHILHRIKL